MGEGIYTETFIEAPAQKIWNLLINFSENPRWNPLIREVVGVAEEGEKLTIKIQFSSQSSMTFKPTVLAAKPNQALR